MQLSGSWQGASSAPGTAKVPHGGCETGHVQVQPGESTDGLIHRGERTGAGRIAGFEISEHIASAGSETAHVSLKGKGKREWMCHFVKSRFLSSSLSSPSSSTLALSLHSRSQNLFIGSVYRCSNNRTHTPPPPRKNKNHTPGRQADSYRGRGGEKKTTTQISKAH